MQDPTKKIEVELALKKDKFEQDLKSMASSRTGLKSLESRLGKDKTRTEKNILKQRMKLEGPTAQKKNSAAAKKMIQFEEKRLKLISSQIKEVKKLNAELARSYKAQARYSGGMGGRPTMGGVGGAARMLGGVAGAAGLALGGMAVGAVSNQISTGYGKWSQFRQAQGGLVGTGATREQMNAASASGLRRGYSPTETMQQALTAAKATGQASAVTMAQDLGRITAMDAGEASGFMGQLTRGGKGFGGKAGTGGQRELEKVIAAGFASGLDRARMPEFIKGVGKLVEMQGGRQGGDVSSVGFSKMLAAMGATNAAGMQGARGASALAQLNEAMVNPGGGSHGQAIMLQSYGFGKPGGSTSYYDALKRQEQGATNPENVKDMFDEFERQYGGGERGILAMRETTGLSITQLEELRKAKDNLDTEKMQEILDKAKPVEEQSLDAMKEMGTHIERLAGLDSRLVDIGAQNAEQIEHLQDMANATIDELLPVAKGTLTATTSILQALRDEFGISDEGRLKKYASGSAREVQEQYGRDQAQFFVGKISAEESKRRARAALGRQQSIASSGSSYTEKTLADRQITEMNRLEGALGSGPDRRVRQGMLTGSFGFDTSSGKGKQYQAQLEEIRGKFQAAIKTDSREDDIKVLRMMRAGDAKYGEMFTAMMRAFIETNSNVQELSVTMNQGSTKANASKRAQASGTQGRLYSGE